VAGFDFTGGKKPTTMQMMKLAFNSEVKAASLRLKEELDKAGIDITDKVCADVGRTSEND